MNNIYRCSCGWEGPQERLINPGALGDDIHVEGERCPKCWGEVEELETELTNGSPCDVEGCDGHIKVSTRLETAGGLSQLVRIEACDRDGCPYMRSMPVMPHSPKFTGIEEVA